MTGPAIFHCNIPDYVSTDTAELARFNQESSVSAGLDHPNICAMHDMNDNNE